MLRVLKIIRIELGEYEGKNDTMPKAHGVHKHACVFIRIHSPTLADVLEILVTS